jgi:uroporphyrinogen-III synthase
MAAQSRNPVILLTRPEAQSHRFAEALRALAPGVVVVVSPLIAPVLMIPDLPRRDWQAVIFSSETAVMAARRIVADGTPLPSRAFCVGRQTARVAREAGFDPVSADGNAENLFDLIVADRAVGPLLYLRGKEAHVDLAERLNSAGIGTDSAIVYAQVEQSLDRNAVTALQGGGPVIAPVFSSRTGTILARELARAKPVVPVIVVAISQAAAEAFPAADVSVARSPDAPAMLQAIASRLSLLSPP